MIGTKAFLVDYQPFKGGKVTFGGGSKGKIVGIGILSIPGLPNLRNVLHVEGLTANLISISQLCDDNWQVRFNKNSCEVYNKDNACLLKGVRSSDNCYLANEKTDEKTDKKCNSAKIDNTYLWHQKLGHTNFCNLDKLTKVDVVQGLPKLTKVEHRVYGDCLKRKQIHASHNAVNYPEQHFGTLRCFKLLHIDLIGPVETESISGKRSDRGGEFINKSLDTFCIKKGIIQKYSAPKMPQQNGVAERKNRTLQEMVRVMLSSKQLAKRFWAEAMNNVCHIVNRVNLRPGTLKTPYEISIWEKAKFEVLS